MPITINGSGTVTGITAGGLPDGVITRPEMGYAGAILQVVSATTTTSVSNSTTTYVDTTLTASITPTSSSSKILVLVSQSGMYRASGNSSNEMTLRLLRGATTLAEFGKAIGSTGTSLDIILSSASTCYLDSPNTTSSTTYKTQFKNGVNAASVVVQAVNDVSSITLLEVAA